MALRFLAQNILTGEWLDEDLPFIRDAESPKWDLSGPGTLTGRVSGDHPTLRRRTLVGVDGLGGLPAGLTYRLADPATLAGAPPGQDILAEWSTAIYLELDGDIVWGGIVQRSDFNGADWTVSVFGFTAYANGIPYTGAYKKLVSADPGTVVAKLWSHVQGQPDGNVGLQLVIPDELGPDVGTKDDPYELSWWEAKDVGAEFQQLASEAPFDYVEEHAWQIRDRAAASGLPAFDVAYGNLHGGYDGSDKGWMKKHADDQCEQIAALGVDLFFAVELHEETSSAMPLGAHRWFEGRMQATQSPFWTLAVGDGGNHALYDSRVLELVSTTVRSGIDLGTAGSGNMRSATRWTFRHRATGYLVEGGDYHLHANDTGGGSRRASRLAEAGDVDVLFPPTGRPPAIVAGDFNSYSMGSDEVYGIIEAQTGLVPVNKRTTPLNAKINSSKSGKKGRWIDNVLTRPGEWDVVYAAGVPTHKITDHQLWIKVTLQARIPQTAIVAPESRKVTHTLTLAYPRAGRRRADLKFVQGDNVTEVVAVSRDGEPFANSVITLGKGEGSKTLRGESTVRDGRLRRPTIYTDKLASSKSRCESLAKRERGWRNLGARVESIVVDGTHPHATMRSWALGDDILLEAYGLPHLGDVVDWYRITAWSLVTDTTARLSLTRADAFTYGPTVPPPSDDLPDDDIEEGVR